MATWKYTQLSLNGKVVKAQAPIIISASRSTDIPAFYADWFFDRLQKRYSAWTNPFNGVKSYVSYEKVSAAVLNFQSENERLSGQVNKLISLQDILSQATNKVNEVKDNISILAHNHKSSQDEQDIELANIKSSLETLSSTVNSYKDAIVATVNDQTSVLKEKNDEINNKVSQANDKLDDIIGVLNQAKDVCRGIDEKVECLKDTLDSRLNNEEKAITLNRWILIIGILVLIALHFM